MGEILFRAKDTNGKMCYGDFLFFNDKYCNIKDRELLRESHLCKTETVGQYIGLKDINGTKIFEGDILKGSWKKIIVIYYDDCYCGFRAKEKSGYHNEIDYFGLNRLEVIGNIHDNPELLSSEVL